MILEGVKGFKREPVFIKGTIEDTISVKALLETARTLEERAIHYYSEEAQKMEALPEVVRALKMAGKKRADHLKRIYELGA